ncbi:MAG: alpha/beta fold hydrolase [Anaerolineae bacterium]|nr:alpha/beta fold hydrolase [Anaerolineae bacterium]
MGFKTNLQTYHIARGAEPFLLDGGKNNDANHGEIGVLCVHGFTASPEEMRWLGEHLHARGLTVYGPRLAGHGTDPAQMGRQRWLDWYEDVLDGVALLRTRCRKVFAVGLSMGGSLCLLAAATGQVDGAVALAAPVYLDVPLMRFTPLIKYARRYRKGKPGDLDDRVRAIQRELGRDDYGRVAYGITPVAAAAQLQALMRVVDEHLPAITVPLLLVYSKVDQTVPYGNLARIAARVTSADLVQRTLERSGHVLTQDSERAAIYDWVWEFLSARLD